MFRARPAQYGSLEGPLEDLAGTFVRQGIGELHHAQDLVAGQMRGDVPAHVVGLERGARLSSTCAASVSPNCSWGTPKTAQSHTPSSAIRHSSTSAG